MTKIVELQPNKALLSSTFEKYQFSSDPLPNIRKHPLHYGVYQQEIDASQDSYLEARLFAFHNHLFKNPYEMTCWFIDNIGNIWKFSAEGCLQKVYSSKFIGIKEKNPTYNPSLGFASKNMVVVSNGAGNLEILMFRNDFVRNFNVNKIEASVVLDAKFFDTTSKLIVALIKIDDGEDKRYSKILLLSYIYEEVGFKIFNTQVIKVKGPVESLYIEHESHVTILGHQEIEFIYDSINPIKNKDVDAEINIPKYCWSQDEDSLTVWVKIADKDYLNNTKIDIKPFDIAIKVDSTLIINGETSHRLHSELSTWKFEENTLKLELAKYETGLMWNELLKGDTGGEYLPNEALANEIHSRLSHLCSEEPDNGHTQPCIGFNSEQLEECDLQGGDNSIQRINILNHAITHMAILGSTNRIIFSQKQKAGQLLCFRHDHDGCIWMTDSKDNDQWELSHIHTYPGFGYVEASKTNKKFCVSPISATYIAIVEHKKHILLYEKPDLNSRIGKQRIFDLENEDSPILGAVALNNSLILLTNSKLYQLQMCS